MPSLTPSALPFLQGSWAGWWKPGSPALLPPWFSRKTTWLSFLKDWRNARLWAYRLIWTQLPPNKLGRFEGFHGIRRGEDAVLEGRWALSWGHSAVHLSVVAHAYFGPQSGWLHPYVPVPLGMVEAGSPTHLPILPLSEDPTLAIQPHLWLTNHLGLEMDHYLYTAVAAEILVFREYK